ncbi:hypothetical protein F4779DRAFT_610643 [Xylariaceae sp. FL0662B]|nr:hypothetical protein F4779DRAFT_610643 [Xylariaceae sp. FL0662B]
MNFSVPTFTPSALSNLLSSPSSSPPSPSSWKSYIIPAILAYVLLCQALRFRREKATRRRFGYAAGDRAALARMTNDEAQQILHTGMAWEFPLFHYLSLQFGLFKTYGIESISRLLLATRNLTDPVKGRKRFIDTAALISEILVNAPTSPRTMQGLARTNYLHSAYVASGQISNADLLYTLSVFLGEPARCIGMYEWRALNDMEVCALGVFWKSAGDALGIRYDGFLARDRWRDGIEFFDDLVAWAKDYEVRNMRPSPVAAKPAETLIPIVTYWMPWFAKAFAAQAAIVFVDDRTREAFMLPKPDILASALVYSSLALRRFVLRYLSLPRVFEQRYVSDPDPQTGRIYRLERGAFPFYVRPTVWNRWGPVAWAIWLYGGELPGDDPDQYQPQGYLFSELGPRNKTGKGAQEMEGDVEKMRARSRGGCPF